MFKAFVSVLALIIVFLFGGMAIAQFTGGEVADTADKLIAKAKPDSSLSPIKTTPPSPNASVGVSLSSITSPITPGNNASLYVRTTATATCSVIVTLNGVTSTDSGLGQKKADAHGVVSWVWTIPASAQPGIWPIKVTCNYNGKQAVLDTKIEVVKVKP